MNSPKVNLCLMGLLLLTTACPKPASLPKNSGPVACAVVQASCCTCNESGKQIAIPQAEMEDYLADIDAKCVDVACIQMISTDPSCKATTATYRNGRCELDL